MMSRTTSRNSLLCFLFLLTFTTWVSGQRIGSVDEAGSGLDPAGVYFTGQTFDHEVEGVDFTVPSLDEDVPFFTDRNHEYNGISVEESIAELNLVGAEYIMTANDNRGVGDYIMDIEIVQPADIYVLMDQRVTEPQWLPDEEWIWTGHEMGIDEGGDSVGPGLGLNQRFWLWAKFDVEPGLITTYERGGTGNNMYGVVVTEPGVGPGIKDYPEEWPGEDFKPGNFGLVDIGATGGRAERDALQDLDEIAQIGAAAHNQNDIELTLRDMTSSLGDDFSISIDNLDEDETFVGGLDWRDRGNSAIADLFDLPLLKMGEDLVKNNEGVIRVTLSDLPAGPYQVTSFHIDPGFTQCEAIEILVDVGDGSGYQDTGVLGDASLYGDGISGLTPEIMLDSGATFSFEADGSNEVMILFDGRFAVDTEVPLAGLNIQFGDVSVMGDYNNNGELDTGDLDLQAEAIAGGQDPPEFDLNGDGVVDADGDRIFWLHELKKTYVGDADLDGLFDSQDFVAVFVTGKYETGDKALWSEGDWNADLLFDSGDFVAAFVDGGYEMGEFPGAVKAVPEPTSVVLLTLALLGLVATRRR